MKIFNALRKRITASAQPCQSASSLPRHSLRMLLALSILLALLAACGDESSSSVSPEPGDDSSSSVIPASSGDLQSSSSQKSSGKDKSSSSIEEKSSSSVSGKNSSSSVVESSSSELIFHRCDDGDTSSSEGGGYVYYFICKNNEWEEYRKARLDSLDSLAAIEKNKEHPNLDSLFAGYDGEYLEFEDPRDGHKYKYIEFHGYTDDVGSHATFYVMAENLNYGKIVPRGTTKFDDKVTEKLCYVDDEWFCDNHFGGLYTWAEAMNLPKVCDSVEVSSNDACKAYADSARNSEKMRTIVWQGICPDGWHIMNQREWLYAGGDLRSKALWEDYAGYNRTGMSIIPTERLQTGVYTAFWMPSALESNVAKAVYFYSVSNNADLSGADITRRTFRSIRCVMDANNSLTEN
ncbi:FISUMP domain-containing protein [uncultured Fibrobacter sp.]|uniref:FISUMP domain-containing protein n=1 Tax=uncultured Fibrobacter sp. TaxID=261512 RepID=UPI0025F175A0|nr:FISUMP domain-containing protein [uncultured Fibrobacter sp.]